MALNSSGTGLDTSYITPTQLYVGTEAIDIVKAYCRSGASSYVYEDAPDGYSWHVLEYTLETDPEELYVDIKLKGLDGEKLKFRGVTVSSRTRDIFSYCTKTESGFEKLYCYYAVPNGCMEYMIECGTRVNDTSDTACYHIKDYQ